MLELSYIRSILYVVLCLVLLFPDNNLLANRTIEGFPIVQTETTNSNVFFFKQKVNRERFTEDALEAYKERAIFAAKNDALKMASENAENYIKYSADVGFIDSRYFYRFKGTEEFSELAKKYSINFSWLNLFYLFSSVIGFFIFFLLFFRKEKDRVATVLISSFVLINSSFILHIFLFLTNLKYRTPHILYMSAITIYLYGPLIYFYFKRIALNYEFRKVDLLHLLPTVVVLIIFFPILILPAQEKLNIMLDVGSLDRRPYLLLTVSTKIMSLLVYGCLLLRLYLKNKKRIALFTVVLQRWMFNIVLFVEVYVVSYLIYGMIIMKIIPRNEFIYNLQICSITAMVLYIGYISYLRPNLFAIEAISLIRRKGKYVKSSLTPSYSKELKEKLIYLLESEKIYKQNNINLDFLSQRLDTTRHNASQVINENFNVSFFELINTYRIEEALEILKNDTDKKMNIIEVAYEVGFNNKVSFNKSFKKHLSQTPSQYIGSLKLK